MEHYYQSEIECASREQIRAWQNERLIPTVKRVYENVPYYRHLMEEKGVTPDDIRSVDDLHKLPFLTKEDLRQAYPYGLLAVPLEDCVRIQSTSGTTGRRVVAVSYTHLFPHCAISPTAASRRSLGRVSVPMWPINLSVRLPIVALVGLYPAN